MFGSNTIERIYYGKNLIKFGYKGSDSLYETIPGGSGSPGGGGGGGGGSTPTSVSWTEISMPVSTNDAGYQAIAYGNNTFVAARAYSNQANDFAVSTDNGTTWTVYSSPYPILTWWGSIIYGDKFIAGSVYNPVITKSTDGTSWTDVDLTSTGIGAVDSLAYGVGKYVAVRRNLATYSIDGGNNWSAAVPIDPSYVWASSGFTSVAAYGAGKFVAINGNESQAAYSTDGVTWNLTNLPVINSNWKKIIYSNNKFIAIPSYETTGAYSTDGVTWNAMTLPSDQAWYGIAYGNGVYVLLEGFDTQGNVAGFSTDGINWSPASQLSGLYYENVIYGNGVFIAVASSSNNKGAVGIINYT